jgi:hypothetical protein
LAGTVATAARTLGHASSKGCTYNLSSAVVLARKFHSNRAIITRSQVLRCTPPQRLRTVQSCSPIDGLA